jgi:hypothetical protein
LPWTDDFESSFGAFTFDRSRAGAWRSAVGDAAAAELDASLADHLTRHGYDV